VVVRFTWVFRHFAELSLAGLAVLLFGVATNTQTGWLFVLSASIFGALLVGFVTPRRELKKCSVRLEWSGHGRVGEPVECRVTLLAPFASGRFPVIVSVPRQPWEELVVEVVRRRRRRRPVKLRGSVTYGSGHCSFLLNPVRRGVLGELVVQVTSMAPFGWFALTRELRVKANRELVIYPPCHPLERNSPAVHGDDASRQRSQSSDTANAGSRGSSSDGELARLRGYVPGDDLRRVHWASTARNQTLMVKEMSPEPGRGLWVVIDQGVGCLVNPDDPFNPLEQAILRASSWWAVCQKSQRPLTLVYAEGTLLRLVREAHQKALARLECRGQLSSQEVFVQVSQRVPAGCAVVWLGARPATLQADWDVDIFA
jgi:uncharacterized protein (DUF58 family)